MDQKHGPRSTPFAKAFLPSWAARVPCMFAATLVSTAWPKAHSLPPASSWAFPSRCKTWPRSPAPSTPCVISSTPLSRKVSTQSMHLPVRPPSKPLRSSYKYCSNASPCASRNWMQIWHRYLRPNRSPFGKHGTRQCCSSSATYTTRHPHSCSCPGCYTRSVHRYRRSQHSCWHRSRNFAELERSCAHRRSASLAGLCPPTRHDGCAGDGRGRPEQVSACGLPTSMELGVSAHTTRSELRHHARGRPAVRRSPGPAPGQARRLPRHLGQELLDFRLPRSPGARRRKRG